jgi:hypothetical protein
VCLRDRTNVVRVTGPVAMAQALRNKKCQIIQVRKSQMTGPIWRHKRQRNCGVEMATAVNLLPLDAVGYFNA